jgi:hypothetical protein
MGSHETYSIESEWYTPKYVFDALSCSFDMDVAAAPDPSLTFVPAAHFISQGSLEKEWRGFVWCNPPWAGRGSKQPWIDKMAGHVNGLLLTPDRTSAPWWRNVAKNADAVLFVSGKIKFIPGPGNLSNWKQPGTGTCLFAWGALGVFGLLNAQKNGFGLVFSPLIA